MQVTEEKNERLGATCFGAEFKTEDLPNKKQIHNALKDVSASNR